MEWVLCWFGVVFIMDVHMCCGWKGRWIGNKEWMVAQQEKNGKGKGLGEKRGKVVWGKRLSFCICPTVPFTLTFHPFSIHHTTTLVVTSSRHHTTLCSTIFHTSCHTITPIKLIELARTHKLWYSCERPSKTKDGPMSWHWQVLMKHAKTLTSTPSINQNTPSLHLSFHPHSTRLGKMP